MIVLITGVGVVISLMMIFAALWDIGFQLTVIKELLRAIRDKRDV